MPDFHLPIECIAVDFGGTLAHRPDGALSGEVVTTALRDAYEWTSPKDFPQAVDDAMALAKSADRVTGQQTPFSEVLAVAAGNCAASLPDEPGAVEAAVFDAVPDAEVDPAAAQAVRLLAEAGWRLVLASNTRWPRPARIRTLRAAGIAEYFAAVILSSELGVRKPHELFYGAVRKAAECPAERILFVGDTEAKDVAAPRRFGMQALLVAPLWQREVPATNRPPLFEDLPRLISAVEH